MFIELLKPICSYTTEAASRICYLYIESSKAAEGAGCRHAGWPGSSVAGSAASVPTGC